MKKNSSFLTLRRMVILLLLLATISVSLAVGLILWQQHLYSALRINSLTFHSPSIINIADAEHQLNEFRGWLINAKNNQGEILTSERKILEKNPMTYLSQIKKIIILLSDRQSSRQIHSYNRVAENALKHVTALTSLIKNIELNKVIMADKVNRMIQSLKIDFLQWRELHEIDFAEEELSFNILQETTNRFFFVLLTVAFIIAFPVVIIFFRRMNNALVQLENTQNQLFSLNKKLEYRVEERTKELSKTQEELVRKERLAALGQLTGTVSHELRNPLGTITSSIFTLRNKFKLHNIDTDKVIDRIERSVKRCDNIVEDLLQYSRVQALHLESYDFKQWILEIINSYQNLAELSIDYEIDSVGSIQFDSHRLRRVFINLIDNAIRAMSIKDQIIPGSHIQIKISSDQSGITTTISDNGSGISTEDLPLIFEPLYSTHAFGIGLGLPTVKQIMEQHGGTVQVDTNIHNGACFRCWLPYTKVKGEGS